MQLFDEKSKIFSQSFSLIFCHFSQHFWHYETFRNGKNSSFFQKMGFLMFRARVKAFLGLKVFSGAVNSIKLSPYCSSAYLKNLAFLKFERAPTWAVPGFFVASIPCFEYSSKPPSGQITSCLAVSSNFIPCSFLPVF